MLFYKQMAGTTICLLPRRPCRSHLVLDERKKKEIGKREQEMGKEKKMVNRL